MIIRCEYTCATTLWPDKAVEWTGWYHPLEVSIEWDGVGFYVYPFRHYEIINGENENIHVFTEEERELYGLRVLFESIGG